MKDFTSCPNRGQLAEFCQQTLAVEQTDDIQLHLAKCPSCREHVQTLRLDDPLVHWLVRPNPLETIKQDPHFVQLVERALAVPSEASAAPKQIGRYRLLRKLGGNMGMVYEAEHLDLKKKFAVKLLPRQGDPYLLARFKKEMQSLGKLADPHVVGAVNAGEEDGIPFIVMDLVSGTDLARLIKQRGPLPVAWACELARQAALGLEAIHRLRIVHRDVKPGNLMLTDEGVVKVVDLGLAHLPRETEDQSEWTFSQMRLGTPDYMAPEQDSQPQNVDHRADIYSLGCTLYKLLIGQAPFAPPRYQTITEKLWAHHHDMPSMDPFRNVDPEVVRIVERMMAKKPEDRFAAADEVARVLEPWSSVEVAGLTAGELRPTRTQKSTHVSTTGSLVHKIGFLLLVTLLFTLATWTTAPWFAALFSPAIPPRNARPLDSLPIDEFENLFERPPAEAIWPPSGSTYSLEPAPLQLHVDCTDIGLLQLGSTQRDSYQLRVEIFQSRFSSGIGVFWGLHEINYQGRKALKYQILQVSRIDNRDSRFDFMLTRGSQLAWKNERGEWKFEDGGDVASDSIVRDAPKQELILHVRKGRLVEVRWGGRLLRQLTSSANDVFAPSDYRGSLGTFNYQSTSIYTRAEFMPQKPWR